MISSWISALLPDDEYKKQRMLYFIAEGAIVLLSFLGILFSVKHFSNWGPDVEIVLGMAIVVFVLYVFFRYTFSGIEYTDVTTVKQYRKEVKLFIKKSIIFAVLFAVTYVLFIGKEEWIDALAVASIGSIVLFLINFISLYRSYRINKQLEED